MNHMNISSSKCVPHIVALDLLQFSSLLLQCGSSVNICDLPNKDPPEMIDPLKAR